ncbi:MAG TPA: T9SS type A sorting domain-containing protein [Chitinophagales bacterium]|nr:T9SS type A sorting domain-containing protein [Chitinophagales bacterium]
MKKILLLCINAITLCNYNEIAAQTIQTNPLPIGDLPEGSKPGTEMAVLEHNQLIVSYNPGTSPLGIALLDGESGSVLPLKTFMTSIKLNPVALSANRALFTGVQNSTGQELWTTGKTPAGTVLVKDINPGHNSSGITFGAILNNKLFFLAHETGTDDDPGPFSLWITDGTPGGTTKLADSVRKDAVHSYGPFVYVIYKNAFYFYGSNPATGVTELWRSDGTLSGTFKIMVLNDFEPQRTDLAVLNDTLYFHGYDVAHGEELWRSKGTFNSTVLVKDLNPGPGSSYPKGLTAYHGKVWFTATDGSGYKLWHTNGTVANTEALTTGLSAEDYILGATSSKLYFTIDVSTWLTDGTNGGTAKLTFPSLTNDVEWPQNLHEINGVAYFTMTDYALNAVKNNGTPSGTYLVLNNFYGLSDGLIDTRQYNGRMVFTGGDISALGETDGITDRDYANTYLTKLLVQDEKYVYLSLGTDSINAFWRIDMTKPITSEEVCNGLDDNTNGEVDDIAQFYNAAPAYEICKKSDLKLTVIVKDGFTYQWLKNEVPIAGATKYYYVADTKGDYSFIASKDGCIDTSIVIEVSTLPTPAANITPLGSLDICPTGSVTLQASGGSGLSYQWYKGSTPISGATNQLYTATAEKKYWVEITGSNGCSNKSKKVEVYSSCKTMADLQEDAIEITIHPNPVSAILYVDMKGVFTNGEIIIHDISGKSMLQQMVSETSNEINVSTLIPGIYFMEIRDAISVVALKFVVER